MKEDSRRVKARQTVRPMNRSRYHCCVVDVGLHSVLHSSIFVCSMWSVDWPSCVKCHLRYVARPRTYI